MDLSFQLPSSNAAAGEASEAKLFSLERSLKSKETPDELKKVAREFESIFMQQVFQMMDKTVDRSDGMLSGGAAEETFRGMFYESIASEMGKPTSNASMGLSDAIYRQLVVNMPQAQASTDSTVPITLTDKRG